MDATLYYSTFKEILLEYANTYSLKPFALFLSAGYDSRSILYMCKILDVPLHCYTFTLSDRMSTDARVALSEAHKCGYECSVVKIPIDNDVIITDLKLLAEVYDCKLKTEFECTLPLYYLHSAVEEKIILVGTDADNYFACGSKYGLHYRKFGELGLSKYKEDKPKNTDVRYKHQEIFADAEFKQRMLLCEKFNQIELDPYNTRKMYNIFVDTTWDELNKPKYKWPIYESFQYWFSNEPPYRTSYQCGDSGIRELCASVLLNSEFNVKNYKSVVGCYNELVRRVFDDRNRPKLF